MQAFGIVVGKGSTGMSRRRAVFGKDLVHTKGIAKVAWTSRRHVMTRILKDASHWLTQ